MKKFRRKRRCAAFLLALACSVSLLLAPVESVHAESESVTEELEQELQEVMPDRGSFLFEDGDVVGFIGDSITQVEYTGISYQEFIYNYYITRYPQWDLEFRNLGTASYTAADAVRLYSDSAEVVDQAIDGINKAVVMFGMNEALNGWSANRYIQSMGQLVRLLNEKGIESEDIILVAPTPYDQTRSSNYDENGEQIENTDDLLLEYTGELKKLAEELGTHYIDLHTPMLWVTEIVQEKIPDDTLTVTDNVHPNAMGNTIAGFFFLYQQGADNLVASLAVDEETGTGGENVFVKKLRRKGDRYVSLRYQAQTLPMAVTYEFGEATQYFEIVDAINWEDLSVGGLAADTEYRVFMDGTLAGTFTGSELAEGVNLAALDWNPGQVAAKEIEVLNQQWHTASSDYRAVVRQAMKGEADQASVDAAYETWEATTGDLRQQMYAIAQKHIAKTHRIEVVSEGYYVFYGHEVWEWVVFLAGVAAVAAGGTFWLLRRRRKKRQAAGK